MDKKDIFREYSPAKDIPSHFIILEIEGDMTDAQDFLNTIEKLEYKRLSLGAILPLQEFHDLVC